MSVGTSGFDEAQRSDRSRASDRSGVIEGVASADERRLRIAIVAPPWLPVPPPAYGGTEVVLDRLARGLMDRGHEVVLVAHRDSTCPVPHAWVLPSLGGAPMGSATHEVRHILGAYAFIGEWGADVVHDHSVVGPLYGVHEADRTRPLVVTNHGPFNDDTSPLFLAIAARAAIVCISRSQAATARHRHLPVAAVIHHGLDVERFPLGTGGGGYAAFLGRMNPLKGVHLAIDAARLAGVPLRIAAKMAEPPELAYFEAEVRPRLGGDIEYLGELGYEDKVRLLADAAVLVNPIQWPEPFGMVMIEAMACGTPVIAGPHGAAPEIVVPGTGWLRASVEGVAEALGEVMGVPPSPVMRAACRERVHRAFSMEKMAAEHEDLYRRLLKASVRV